MCIGKLSKGPLTICLQKASAAINPSTVPELNSSRNFHVKNLAGLIGFIDQSSFSKALDAGW